MEQERDTIQKKLGTMTKELEKVKKAAAREIGNFNDAEEHAILRSSATAISMPKAAGACYATTRLSSLRRSREKAKAVKRRLSPANFEPDKDLYVALAITASIRAWMPELKSTKLLVSWPFSE